MRHRPNRLLLVGQLLVSVGAVLTLLFFMGLLLLVAYLLI